MRWFWIDRFIDFESGSSARAIKNVTLAEEHLHDHFPGFAVMPGSLMLEGMAQTGGILLGEAKKFEHIVILAKVSKVTFHRRVRPGDSLIYEAKLIDVREEGGSVECTATVDGELAAEAEIVFAHLDQNNEEFGAIDQKNFVFSMNLLGALNISRPENGGDPTES